MSPEKINRRLSTHRFDISERASENLASIKRVLTGYQQNHPEVIGMTMYGSQTKGLDTETSDFDGYLFVEDESGLPSDPSEPKRITPQDIDPTYDKVYSNVAPEFRSLVERELQIPPERTKHIKVRILSKERIDTEVNDLLSYCLAREEYFDDTNKTYPDLPSSSLDLLFHLQLGNGLDHYRAYTLNRLKNGGAIGELAWKLILESTVIMETRGRKNPEPYLYPKTLDEAIKRYGLTNTLALSALVKETTQQDLQQLDSLRQSIEDE